MTTDRVSEDLILAVTLGDPQGIGPEVSLQAIEALSAEDARLHFLVFGHPEAFERAGGAPRATASGRLRFAGGPASPLDAPPPSRVGGASALAALMDAVAAIEEQRAHALVTAPLSKEAVARSSPGFRGHTAWLGEHFGTEPLMCLATIGLRVFLVTDHLPLAKVSEAIDAPTLRRCLNAARHGLQRDFGVSAPRLAVLALNPHAGEGGELGREELDVIRPAIEEAGGEAGGFCGPFSADSFFRKGVYDRFDGVIAMYHDQGLIPLKMLGFGGAVNISLGLPIVRTSPDHGTAFDLACRERADARSMELALRAAVDLVRRRR